MVRRYGAMPQGIRQVRTRGSWGSVFPKAQCRSEHARSIRTYTIRRGRETSYCQGAAIHAFARSPLSYRKRCSVCQLRRNLGISSGWVSLMNERAHGATSLDLNCRSNCNFIIPRPSRRPNWLGCTKISQPGVVRWVHAVGRVAPCVSFTQPHDLPSSWHPPYP